MRIISTFYIDSNQIQDNKIFIRGNDVKHIKCVLRYKIGDEIDVCDDLANRYKTKLTEFLDDEICLSIMEISNINTEMKISVDLYQGLPKSDKMDLIVQKCTELGVNSVIPVVTERVIVKLDNGKSSKKVERWNKIAAEASKQCGRQKIPNVENVVNLENIVEKLLKYDIVIVPFECENDRTLKSIINNNKNNYKNIAIVIGPEGGFSDKDIATLDSISNTKKVSLGKRILRTETAGMTTLAMIIYEYEL